MQSEGAHLLLLAFAAAAATLVVWRGLPRAAHASEPERAISEGEWSKPPPSLRADAKSLPSFPRNEGGDGPAARDDRRQLGVLNLANYRDPQQVWQKPEAGQSEPLPGSWSEAAACLPVGWAEDRVVPTERAACLLDTPKSDAIRIIERVLVGLPRGGRCGGGKTGCDYSQIKPYDESLRMYGNDWPPFGYTMVGTARLENLRAAVTEVVAQQVAGDIVELGVWRGGAMIMAAAVLRDLGEQRALHLFDAFEHIPGYKRSADYIAVSEMEVRSAFEDFDLQGPHVHFHPGLFKDTVPTWDANTPIAILRIDGNFYDSYQDALYYMYERVPVGGIVIFDDVMTHKAVMRCWVDFKTEQGLPETLNRIDQHSAWFRKERLVSIDWKFFRPPQDVNKS